MERLKDYKSGKIVGNDFGFYFFIMTYEKNLLDYFVLGSCHFLVPIIYEIVQ